jgi:hypothetical protein
VDVTLPFDLMAIEDEQPVLTIVTMGFFMATSLVFPAVVDAARRRCLSVGSFLPDHPVARFWDDPRSPSDPRAPELGAKGHGDCGRESRARDRASRPGRPARDEP